MAKKIGKYLAYIAALCIFLQPALYSKDHEYLPIDIVKLSRYDEDRVMYQHIETPHGEFSQDQADNSVASLMVIKDKRVFLFRDGYDSPEQARLNMAMYDKGGQLLPDIWINKIDGVPDYVLVTDRKIEIQKNTTKEWVSSNYQDFYSRVREKFLKKQVAIFLSLIVNRREAEIAVERRRLPKKTLVEGEAVRYITTVTGRTADGGTVYYAEDADGDGVTETFTVNCSDGFHWGFRSGPNVVCIVRNTQKDIENIIGTLTNLAYNGSPEEEQIIKKTFPTPEKVNSMIDTLYNIDAETERFLKKNNINLEEGVNRKSSQEKK
ncbi:MAG: hypothetical protein JXA07_00850 [Spirochaetes bacterium]|nr:hypothetical protein [Spirochaetota bacterium]